MYQPTIEEHHKVLIAKGAFRDDDRERDVPFKIYYPVNHNMTGLPVVIWSHGLGGSRDGAGFLSRFLASHGYVLVHVQHIGTDSSLWEGKPGHPWDVIRRDGYSREAVIDRYRDIPFVLDQLPQWMKDNPDVGQHMNMSVLGMSGHSFGANTTQVMAGQMIGHGASRRSMREERFRAGILYSPVPSSNTEDPAKVIYGDIAIPLMHMTGTDDTSPIEGFGYERRLEVFQNSGGPEQHLLVLDDGDHMVYNGSRGQLAENPKRKAHEEIIKVAALAFSDSYLKDIGEAKEWLCGGGFAGWLGTQGRYKVRA